jgi:hypothetical protein
MDSPPLVKHFVTDHRNRLTDFDGQLPMLQTVGTSARAS